MRRLILVTAIALMSTTSCYANLSIADATPQSQADVSSQQTGPARPQIAQPMAQKPAVKPVAESRSAPVAASVSRPHHRHISYAPRDVYHWSGHCW
jgi:hypothetical protein